MSSDGMQVAPRTPKVYQVLEMRDFVVCAQASAQRDVGARRRRNRTSHRGHDDFCELPLRASPRACLEVQRAVLHKAHSHPDLPGFVALLCCRCKEAERM